MQMQVIDFIHRALTRSFGSWHLSCAPVRKKNSRRSAILRDAAVAEPLGHAESEQQAAEGNARQGDDKSEPAGVGAGAGG